MDYLPSDLPDVATRTEPANDEPIKSPLPAEEIFEGLSLVLSIEEILQLHRHLRHRSESDIRTLAEQCHRSSAALSNSQRSSRSSLVTRFSRISLASSASATSHEFTSFQPQLSNTSGGQFSLAPESEDPSNEYLSPAPNIGRVENDTSDPLLGLGLSPAAHEPAYKVADGPGRVNHVPTHPTISVTFPRASPALPCPQVGQAPLACSICYACNTSFKNASTLAKHQTEFCERKAEWICPACPHKAFGLQERLNRHHMEVHAETCPYGCDKKEKLHSEACKTLLSKCSKRITTKKAWGCPCCIQCFESLEEWSCHVRDHPVQNEKVQDWSFSTMIWSLLHQSYLSEYMSEDMIWEHWQCCNWSTLSKEARHGLRFALERGEVPADVRAHPDGSNLNHPRALASYAFNLGTNGKAYPHKTTGTTKGSPYQSSPSSAHNINSPDSPYYQTARDTSAQSQASLIGRFNDQCEESSSFRERVWSQPSTRPRQGRRTIPEQSDAQSSIPDDPRHPPLDPSKRDTGYHCLNRSEYRPATKYASNNSAHVMYPPATPHLKSVSYYPSAPQGSDSTKPLKVHLSQPGLEPRRLQTKKSQANIHGRFACNPDSALQSDAAPPLPASWQAPQHFGLDTNSHTLPFDHTAPQQSHTAPSRPVTPAKSEASQGSWTKLLTSSPSLSGKRYSLAMSLSGPPSDVDMGLV